MKNTQVPLSLAYLDSHGRIQELIDMQPYDRTWHDSSQPMQFALEANQGWFQDHGIQPGDLVDGLQEFSTVNQ